MQSFKAKIRLARKSDLTKLREFEQAIIQYERPFAPNLKPDPIEYYDLANLIERNDAEVIVALYEDELIGSGYALVKDSPAYKKPEKHVYLGFMYVTPEFRGKGVNGKIIDHLIEWTKNQGLSELQLDVYAENESAIKAYAKQKFKPSLLKMRMNLIGE